MVNKSKSAMLPSKFPRIEINFLVILHHRSECVRNKHQTLAEHEKMFGSFLKISTCTHTHKDHTKLSASVAVSIHLLSSFRTGTVGISGGEESKVRRLQNMSAMYHSHFTGIFGRRQRGSIYYRIFSVLSLRSFRSQLLKSFR